MASTANAQAGARPSLDSGDHGVGHWRNRAACLSEDPDLFFPDGTTEPAVKQMEIARQVCNGCTVQFECLHHALSTGMADGVWGATTPEERRSIRRRTCPADRRLLDARVLAAMRSRATDQARRLSYEARLALEPR